MSEDEVFGQYHRSMDMGLLPNSWESHTTHPHTCTPVSGHTRSSPAGLHPPSHLCGWESSRQLTSLAPAAAAAGPLPGPTRRGRK